MDNKQENKLVMYRTTKNVLEENRGVWAGHAGFKAGYDDLNTQVTALNALAEVQRSARAGITLNKQQLKDLMIETTLHVAGALCAFAHKTSDTELKAFSDLEYSDLAGLRDVEVDNRALAIHAKATELLASQPVTLADGAVVSAQDYGLAEATLQMLNNRIAAYAAVAESPRAATVKISTATQAVAESIRAADEILASVLDKLVRQFEPANAEFVAKYRRARVIVDAAASRTSATQAPAPSTQHPGCRKYNLSPQAKFLPPKPAFIQARAFCRPHAGFSTERDWPGQATASPPQTLTRVNDVRHADH